MAESKSSQDSKPASQPSSQQPSAAETPTAASAEEKAAAEKKEARKKAEAAYAKSEKVAVDDKTKDNYAPQPGSETHYHAKIDVRAFSNQDGQKLSTARIQIFAPKAWANFERHSAGLGYHVEILHDPTGEYPVAGLEKAKADAKKAAKKKK